MFYPYFSLLSLILWLLVLVASFMSLSHRRRLKEIERRLAQLETGVQRTPQADSLPAKAGQPEPRFFKPASLPLQPSQPGAVDTLGTWVRENWILAIGALFMMFAVGWLVRYAFMENIIGPFGRVALGVLLGAGILGFGQRRIRTHSNQGSLFVALGAGVLLLSIFAAQQLYHMFDQAASVGLMFFVTAFCAFVSIKFNVRRLCYASLITAGIVPALASTGGHNFVGLFTYLAVITLGTLWVVYLTGWRKNVLIALSMVFIYSLAPWLEMYSWFPGGEKGIGLMFSFGFAATFFATSLLGLIKDHEEKKSDLATAAMNGLFLIFWIMKAAAPELQSLLLAAWALVFAGGTYGLFTKTGRVETFYVYGSVAAALLVAATAVQLSGPEMTLAMIVEAALVPPLVRKITRNASATANSSLLMIGPMLLAIDSAIVHNWPHGEILHAPFFVLLSITIALFALAWFLNRLPEIQEGKTGKNYVGAGIIAGTFYGGWLVWNSFHALLPQDTATAMSLIVYVLLGLASYIGGHARSEKFMRIYGGVLVGGVCLRLVFIDMPDMAVPGRIMTFFVMSLLLLGTAFIEYRKKGAGK